MQQLGIQVVLVSTQDVVKTSMTAAEAAHENVGKHDRTRKSRYGGP